MSKRSSQMFLASLISLFLGGLIGAALFRHSVSAEARSLEPTGSAPEYVMPTTQPLAEAEVVEHLSAPAPRATTARTVVATSAPERPAPPPPTLDAGARTGRIVGSVVTLDGRPLAGVELELEPPKDAPKYRSRSTHTSADGRFEFTGLPDGVWNLTGGHQDFVLQRRTSLPARVPTGAEVEFLACPGVSVEVSVEGEGASRARVAYRRQGEDEPRWSSWSPESPRLALRPGAWELCASIDALEDWPSEQGWKLAPASSQVHTVHVGAEEAPQVILELEPRNCLHGTVRLPEGYQGDEECHVRLIETLDGTRADFEAPGDRSTRYASIDAQGRYGLFHLPYERWTAGVASYWGTPSAAQVLEVHGLTRADFDQGAESGEGSVWIDAFSPSGLRITEGLSLSFVHRNPQDEPDDFLWQPTRTVLEPDGSLRVIALPMDADDAKKAERKEQLFLRADMAGFARIDLPLAGLDGQHLELRFTSSAELEVILVGEGGVRAMRKCYGVLKGQGCEAEPEFDEASGSLKFRGLLPGRYKLTLSMWARFEGGSRQERLYQGDLEVRGGERMEIRMPRRADLVVRCPGVKEDVRAALFGPLLEDATVDQAEDWQGTWARAEVEETGVVRFENMLEGIYRLTIGQRMQIVRVPSPTLDFEGELPTRHRLRLTDGDSPLRRAGAHSGDILVGIDGAEMAKAAVEERLSALSSQSSGQLLLTVERLGRRLDLALDASDLKEGESFALGLEPDLD